MRVRSVTKSTGSGRPEGEPLRAPRRAPKAGEPVSAEQARTVVKRLRVLLGEGIGNAERCGVTLSAGQLLRVCDDLLHEARETGFRPDYGESVEGFLLSGIFDDLVQQPSNIFETVTHADGRQFYVPINAANWIACLEVLRLSLSVAQ